jgi:thiol-disulfide isomerase/thioredoxin
MLKSGIVIFFLAFAISVQSQIQVYNFDELEPLLHQENDTTYVINFWATWCLPCVKELPAFERINQDYKTEKFKMILVSLDFGKDVLEKLEAYKIAKGLSAEIVLLDDPDANAWIPKIDKNWSGAIPATIIYKNKKWQFYGHSFNYEELKTEIEKL